MNKNDALVCRILELCGQKHLSLSMLKRLSGVSDQTFAAILNGRHQSFKFTSLLKICKALDVSIAEFFDSDLFSGEVLREQADKRKGNADWKRKKQ